LEGGIEFENHREIFTIEKKGWWREAACEDT
jgi:hypothetical protein